MNSNASVISYSKALLISDLHLCESKPAISEAFVDFLQKRTPKVDALFILGDLFEYWVGDDALTAFHLNIASALKAASAHCDLYIMVGNRDFALGSTYIEHCGAAFLADPSLVELGQKTWLLSHGDALCTDDVSYQIFRRIIRHPWVLSMLRRSPVKWRIRLADRLRAKSRERYHRHPIRIDVNLQTTIEWMAQYKTHHLIHGHTHQADWHHHPLPDGNQIERLVLGDWHQEGWCIHINENDVNLERFDIPHS